MTNAERKAATPHTAAVLDSQRHRLPLEDQTDFEFASRGFLSPPLRSTITAAGGHVVWDHEAYEFLKQPAAPTTHPSLWRQAQLNAKAGLFEVSPGVYQVRGFDLSNVTFVRGSTGWIVIDPLTAAECASAAMELVSHCLGENPVVAVIYTHSHTDHFGGIAGILPAGNGSVPIYAPAGFMEAAVSENVIAGTAMMRRATYMYGSLLPRDAQGHIDTGLGKGLPSLPSVSLVAPTIEIGAIEERHIIDGVEVVFQLTPGTEAPAEMNIFLPSMRALCMAENCSANLHNLYTLRGAQIRDGLAWSKYIQESFERYADEVDVVFASHHWPRWGSQAIRDFLQDQRDAYRYIHDQTMRLANHGLTMNEIAEQIELPEHLYRRFYNRDYYGTVRHNAKAVYQRYLGWFSGNPAHLNPHTPVEAAQRYVAFIGGADRVLELAQRSFEEGDYRWVAEVVNHVVFAEPDNEAARLLQADALEQLGYQSESGPWRDFYLTGAHELRSNGTILKGLKVSALGPSLLENMTLEMLSDVIGVRLNGPKASSDYYRVALRATDRTEPELHFAIRGGVLSVLSRPDSEPADFSLSAPFAALAEFASGKLDLAGFRSVDGATFTGDSERFEEFLASFDQFTFGFELVLP